MVSWKNISQNEEYISEKCKTTEHEDAPQKGVECIFPMKYDGKIYNGCVPDQGTSSWCSTKGIILKMIFVIFWTVGGNIIFL